MKDKVITQEFRWAPACVRGLAAEWHRTSGWASARRVMIDDGVRIGRKYALMALVPRLCSARAGLLTPLLAVRRGSFDEVRDVLAGR